MTFEEVKQFFEANKDSDEVKNFLSGLNTPTLDGVRKFLTDNNDAKSWFDSEKDKHFSKGLETWRTNNLNKIIDEEVKKRFPDKDPKDLELEKLQRAIEEMRTENLRKDLKNKAIEYATEKKIPVKLVDYFLGADEKTTLENLGLFQSIYEQEKSTAIEEKLKGGYQPPAGGNPPKDETQMSDAEWFAYKQSQQK